MATAYCAASSRPASSSSRSMAALASMTRVPVRTQAGVVDRGGRLVAVRGGQTLPFDRERTVPLEVAERPVVAAHVEPVVGALPRAARLVPAVRAVAQRRRQDVGSLFGRQLARDRQQLVVGEVALRVQRRGDDLHLAVGVPVGERDLRPRLGFDPRQHLGRDVLDAVARLAPVRGSTRRRARRRRRASGTPGSPCGARSASARRTRASRRAGARPGASAAARTTGRSRRSPGWSASRPAAASAACRTSSP